jgi:rhodanese-related sulfurtransferase
MNSTIQVEITPQTSMGDILNHYPSAKRALFQKYHIGGCSSCGYSLDESLEDVMLNHKREKEVGNAIKYIYESAEVDKLLQISPMDLKVKIDSGSPILLVDVREDWEIEIARLPKSEVISQKLAYEILNKMDKNSEVIFYCHHGQRSLEAASYFKGHGLPNVKSLQGGIHLYSQEIDSTIPKY